MVTQWDNHFIIWSVRNPEGAHGDGETKYDRHWQLCPSLEDAQTKYVELDAEEDTLEINITLAIQSTTYHVYERMQGIKGDPAIYAKMDLDRPSRN